MTDPALDTIILPTGGSGFAPRPPAPDDADECPPCEELARIRAALVEMRRGVLSLERGIAALAVAVERDGCG